MSANFRTVKEAATVEIVIKKSRFIAYARPVSTEEQALSFIREISKQHGDATHNCFAYLLNEQVQKQSDDGEPSGTAGKPILEAIKHKQLQQVAVVVTRYFGGTMLGAGGLIRAYSEAASLALEKAIPVTERLHVELFLSIDYHWLGKIEHEIRMRHWLKGETVFAERIQMCLLPPMEEAQNVLELVTEWTQGQAGCVLGKQIYIQS
jgi:uncharacterized YigZ family protein